MTVETEDILKKEIISQEGLIVGLMWNHPDIYNSYSKDKFSQKHFGNKVYGFFLELGRYMNEKGISILDDISTSQAISELNYSSHYEKYGGFECVNELKDEAKHKKDNFDSYLKDIKKYYIMRELREIYGEKVITKEGKYDYKKMTAEQIISYWQDKVNHLSMNLDSQIVDFDLLEGLDELIVQLDTKPDIGRPYYNSELLTEINSGRGDGTVTLLSAFSGNGKTSWMVEKIIMSCIEREEKLAIIANEMSIKDYQKMLLITIIGAELYGKFDNKGFNRKNINKGNFTEVEKKKLFAASDWVRDKVKNSKIIKFIPMENYTMDNVEKVVRYWANRGYSEWVIDTAKPSMSGGSDQKRWERFVEDSERLYQLARKDAGGLNLIMHWNVQNADEALKMRYLDERCLADGRKIKNVVDTSFHMRPVWEDEYKDKKKQITFYKWGVDEFKGDGTFIKKPIKKDPHPVEGKVYFAVFCSKNRRGMSNLTGLDPLIFKVNFNSNRWVEVGFAEIEKDYSY